MRVFVTGGSGFVGTAVIRELLQAGHEVLALARSEAAATALKQAGAGVLPGSLEDLESLRTGAGQADAVIHAAFNHDFSRFAANSEMDRRAIVTMGDVLAGSNRPLLATSGLAKLAQGRPALESDTAPAPSAQYPRASEDAVIALQQRGVNARVVRLPPSVHGQGDHGFLAIFQRIAQERGVSAYIDEDLHWSAVHRADAARVYRLALEQADAAGPFHAVGEDSVSLRDIAGLIANKLGVPLRAMPREEAANHFGWFASFAALHMLGSSQHTRNVLGWQPTQLGLLEDLAHPHYFEPATATV